MSKINRQEDIWEWSNQSVVETIKSDRNSVRRIQFDVNLSLSMLLNWLIESMEATSYAEVIRKGIPVLEYIHSLDEVWGTLYTLSPEFERYKIYPVKNSAINTYEIDEKKRIQLDCNPRTLDRLKKLCVYFNLNQSELLREIIRILHQLKTGIGGKVYKDTAWESISVVFPLL